MMPPYASTITPIKLLSFLEVKLHPQMLRPSALPVRSLHLSTCFQKVPLSPSFPLAILPSHTLLAASARTMVHAVGGGLIAEHKMAA